VCPYVKVTEFFAQDLPYFFEMFSLSSESDEESDGLSSVFFRTCSSRKEPDDAGVLASNRNQETIEYLRNPLLQRKELFFNYAPAPPTSVSRDPIEQQLRKRQTKDHERMLQVLETFEDDESFVKSTLDSLDLSSHKSPAVLFHEIIESTAPYQPASPGGVMWKQWSKILLPYLRSIRKRVSSAYVPWLSAMVIYTMFRYAFFQSPISMKLSNDQFDTSSDSTTLQKKFSDGRVSLAKIKGPALTLPQNLLLSEKTSTSGMTNKDALNLDFPFDADSMKFDHTPKISEDWISSKERMKKIQSLKAQGHISKSSVIDSIPTNTLELLQHSNLEKGIANENHQTRNVMLQDDSNVPQKSKETERFTMDSSQIAGGQGKTQKKDDGYQRNPQHISGQQQSGQHPKIFKTEQHHNIFNTAQHPIKPEPLTPLQSQSSQKSSGKEKYLWKPRKRGENKVKLPNLISSSII
jgi:hypothetical protein